MSKQCGIYLITHTASGKIYVGQSINIQRRWWTHGAGSQLSCPKLHRAIKKHGKAAFTYTVLEECPEEQLTEREQFYLDTLQPFEDRGYNLSKVASPGVSNKGVPKTGRTKVGKDNCHNKQVCQYGHDGSLLHTFTSIREAAKAPGIGYMGITNCIHGRSRTAGGFFWALQGTIPIIREKQTRKGLNHTDETKSKISKANKSKAGVRGANNPASKKVIVTHLGSNEVRIFDTIRDTAAFLNVYHTTVTNRCSCGPWRIKDFVLEFMTSACHERQQLSLE